MAVITISKEFGTEGEKVASRVAEKLGYEYIGKNIYLKVKRQRFTKLPSHGSFVLSIVTLALLSRR
ncbi:MAG: cytidylate kinase family protein [Deltaproteobacteria bacterium]|nr:cytidylate kinase family protein [Deltaproteobacteria bacterium]